MKFVPCEPARRVRGAAGSAVLSAVCCLGLVACGPGQEREEARSAPPAAASPEPAATPSAEPPAAEVEILDLGPGRPLERELAGGELHAYRIVLEADQYLHLVVDQRGVDVIVTLFDSAGKRLLGVDGLTGAKGPESLDWLAETSGSYRLEVSAGGNQETGRYEVRVDEPRIATETDARRVAAAKAFDEAELLRGKGDRASKLLATSKYEEALALWDAPDDLGEPSREVEALYHIGFVYQDLLREQRKALEIYQRALPLLEEVENPWLEASISHNLGNIWWDQGEIDWSLDHFRRALRLRRQLGDPSLEALTLNDLGLVHTRVGEAQEALDCFNRTVALRRQTGERFQEATALHNRGTVYISLGRRAQALDDFNQALAIRREIDDERGQASTLTAIGQVYRRTGALEKALGCFQEGLKLRKRVEDLLGQAVTLNNMGVVYGRRGEKEKALATYEGALSIFHQEGHRRYEANVHYNIGVVLTSSDQPEEALEHYLRALRIFEVFRDQAGVAETLMGMAHAERKRDEFLESRELVEKALEKIEDLRTKPASPDFRSTYLATKQKYYDFYVDLLMELHRLQPSAGHDAAALSASERARARSLLEILIESRANPLGDAQTELIEREQQLGRRIQTKVLQRMERLEGALSTTVVERELRALTGQLRELRRKIRIRSPRYAALTQPQPLDAGEIQRRVLDEETLLLEYQLGEDRSFLWAVTPDSIASFELPPRAEIERVARRTYDLLVISNQRRYRVRTEKTLATLSELLLGPVVEHLGSKRLLIVAEGALQYIPFGALPVPDRSRAAFEAANHPVPLIVEHEIVSVPSASALDVLRRQVTGRPPASGVVAVLADPVFRSDDPRVRGNRTRDGPRSSRAGADTRGEPPLTDPSRYQRLGYSRQEAEAILDLVPAEGRFAALDFKASLETATRGDLGRYRIVHFATHGEFDTAHPELSHLVLSLVDDQGRVRDGFLFAHQIYKLELPAELVVLSSCHSALGTEIHGEGLVGLTQGFMYSGAARVLVSLWSVDDQATAALMKRFYQHLLEDGLRPAEALRKAQISVGREQLWQAPYYWAGFVLQGEWR